MILTPIYRDSDSSTQFPTSNLEDFRNRDSTVYKVSETAGLWPEHMHAATLRIKTSFVHCFMLLAPVVQRLDNAIHRINRYPMDKCQQNKLRYPLRKYVKGRHKTHPTAISFPESTFPLISSRFRRTRVTRALGTRLIQRLNPTAWSGSHACAQPIIQAVAAMDSWFRPC